MIFFDGKAPLLNAYVTNAWVAKFWKQPLLEKSSKSGMSRSADLHPLKILHNGRMAGLVKLRRSIEAVTGGLLWAVSNGARQL